MLSVDEDSPADTVDLDKPDCDIRRQRTKEIKWELMKIYQEAYRKYPEYGEIRERDMHRHFQRLERAKPDGFLIATEEDEILGFIVDSPRSLEEERRGVGGIEELVVSPRAKGKGLGKKLLRLAIHNLRRQGCKEIFLEVGRHNLEAQSLYRQHGFKYAGEEDEWIQMIKRIHQKKDLFASRLKEEGAVAAAR